ncbi:MAG: dihydrolipoyl dehydrogenase [Comamonas sp.]|nr:dihydrolipoyl dehydrogenase [Comamonas sp.]
MTSDTIHVDVAVIGAGTAGMHAFSTAHRAGADTVLIDQGPLGTSCARVGCMPSKAVLHAGKRWSTLQSLLPQGASAQLPAGHTTPQQLWQEALTVRDELVDGNVRNVHQLAGERLLQASARFVAPDTLALSDGRKVQARAFVVATGSEAVRPAGLQAELGQALITTDELFYLPQLPRSVAVMGLGAIGLEMGLALSRLGVQVAAAGRSPVLAKIADPEVAQAASHYFSQQLPLALSEAQITVHRDGEGVLMQAGPLRHRAQYLLAALGRKPRWQGLDIAQAGVQLDDKGRPHLDANSLRCAGSQVFVAGDVSAQRALMHEAGHEGTLAAQQALRALGDGDWKNLPERHRTVPMSIVFSDPDIAEVGARFDQLPQDVVIGTVRGSGSGRSKLMQAPHHILRLYAQRSSGRLLGASLMCAGGEHLAHQLAWAVQREETVHSMLQLPYYHPTMEEMIDTALRDMRRSLRKA